MIFSGLIFFLAPTAIFQEAEGTELEFAQERLSQLEAELGPTHLDLVEPLQELCVLYFAEGKINEVLKLTQRQLEIYKKNFGPNHKEVAGGLAAVGAILYFLGEYEESAQTLFKSLDMLIEVEGEGQKSLEVRCNLLSVYIQMGDHEKAILLGEKTLASSESINGKDHIDTGYILLNLATALDARGSYAESERHLRRAFHLFIQEFGRRDAETATVITSLGAVMHIQGDFSGARDFYDEARSILLETYGAGDMRTTGPTENLALLMQELGDTSGALALLKQIYELQKDTLGPEHPEVVRALQRLAHAYFSDHQLKIAEELLLEAAALSQKSKYFAESFELSAILGQLSEISRERGELGKAREFADQSFVMRKNILGINHPDMVGPYERIAKILQEEKSFQEAANFLRKALDICKEVYDSSHPQLAASLNSLASILYLDERYTEARNSYRKSLRSSLLHLSKNLGALTQFERFRYLSQHMGTEPLMLSLTRMTF